MARITGRLRALDVMRLGPGKHSDGGGLRLEVKGDSRCWVYRFTLAGRQHYLGLGGAGAISLKRARELAAEARRQRAEGIDPIAARRQTRAANRLAEFGTITFQEAATRYISTHEHGWSNAKHRGQWHTTLAKYAYPVIGALPVRDIDTPHVLAVLQPRWADRNKTLSRVRSRIENILDWAKVAGYRQGENPARWKGHLSHLLPNPTQLGAVTHLAALSYQEIPSFMAALRARSGTGARCLEFTVLTCARSGEARGARWDEIDLTAATWTVPAVRMKSRREHRVPLSKRAMEVIRDQHNRREGDLVFSGATAGKPPGHSALAKILQHLGRGDLTTHGFRSSFRDWCGECTNFPREVAEAALAHVVGDATERAYARGDVFEKRRKLMDAWSAYCERPPVASEVVSLHTVRSKA